MFVNIAKTLGITEEQLEAERIEREAAKQAVFDKWSDWLNKHRDNAIRQRIALKVIEKLKCGAPEFIKPTKKDLSSVVSWSSSRFNECKKADVVSSFYHSIQNICADEICEGYEYISGCFSEGAHGHGRNRFGAKFARGGTYRMYCILGAPYLMVGQQVICFEGFDYPEIPFDSELEATYAQVEKELHDVDLKF